MAALDLIFFRISGWAIEAGPIGPRPGGIASRRSEERRQGREGIRPEARAKSAGRERGEEPSDH